ncbi:class I SAM-dependent methyltransferase [Massilia genomosp. 1]|uniref:Methyltransferase domain-containing protein n=1 Tax=Massilia genomosp. 1 TaxID=2609280 RepID=A0ABX0N1W7_9BURK|nr:class I SAM-dependent methyltransferase [Massilia genomosp. 1]NHZ64074.1 methyltransferase domain-containing protein [Massilia genomosp. 1]
MSAVLNAVPHAETAPQPPLPPVKLRFMAETDETFLPICEHLCRTVLSHDVALDCDLLDVGCGYGRLAYGLRRAGFRGSYRGFDILSTQVDWLKRNFAQAHDAARYDFDFANVHNARYNPGGLPFEDIKLPYAEASFDCVTSFSVFTHMYEDDIRHYLRRIGPLVRPDGKWLATFFRLPDDFSLLAQHPAMRYRLTEQISPHAFIHNPAEPLHVIAYKESFLRQVFAEEGWSVASHHPGSWLGDPNDGEFQDWFVLRRQGAPAQEPEPPAPAETLAPPTPAAPACNICGGSAFGPGPAGRLASTGAPPCCQSCGSLERQRVVRHMFQAIPVGFLDWRRSLQFSPDQAHNPAWFRSHEVSVYDGPGSLDIQAIARPDGSYDYLTVSHVLECIARDLAAFDELHRVLSPRGLLHIGFGGSELRAVTEDFDVPVDRYANVHRYGRDVYQRFGCAAKGIGMLAVQGIDPVTGASDVAHLFAKDAADIARVRAWLLAWDPALVIVDQQLP